MDVSETFTDVSDALFDVSGVHYIHIKILWVLSCPVDSRNKIALHKFFGIEPALQDDALVISRQKHHRRFAERRGGRRLNRPQTFSANLERFGIKRFFE